MAILVTDKVDFRAKSISSDKDGHFIKISSSTYQEDIAILIFNRAVSKYMKQTVISQQGAGYKTHNYKDINTSLENC